MTDMHSTSPLVSVVVIFLNEERFLNEAIASVQNQTFDCWELLLVDDGSTDGSADIARSAVNEQPHRIRLLSHHDGGNHGMSAARNLALDAAKGRFVAFLDGDDVWLPGKLVHQVELARRHPSAAMVVAPLLRWHRWTGEPDAADLEDIMGVGRRKFGRHPYAGRLVKPPDLVRLMLDDDYFIPGGALIRRDVLNAVGGYHNEFRSLYEDAVVMMRIASLYPVFVDDRIHYLYRMHPASSTTIESSSPTIDRKRKAYLDTTEDHLRNSDLMTPALERALAKARRSTHKRRHRSTRLLGIGRAIGRKVMPRSFRDALRARWRQMTRPEVADGR